MANNFQNLSVKLFADGANLKQIADMATRSYIKGFTTNPSLMRKAGVKNYREFAKEVLLEVKDRPISFEVFSDNRDKMISQGFEIASWGENVNVKIPITNSMGESTTEVIKVLSKEGVSLNITAVMTISQIQNSIDSINKSSNSFISIFAGRIADTGVDPRKIIEEALNIVRQYPHVQLIWASPRELLNVIQANEIGCHVITATTDILEKIDLIGKDLLQYSLETVKMFRDDALASGYQI